MTEHSKKAVFEADPHRILLSGRLGMGGESFILRTLSTSDEDTKAAERLDKIVNDGINAATADQYEEVARYSLDVEAMHGITKLDAPNFMPKTAEWYRNFIESGNAVYGMFDSKGLLISKAGLVLDSEDITQFGISESSLAWKSGRKRFAKDGQNTLATVLATHPGFQSHGFQRRVLTAAFTDVSNGMHPEGIDKDTAYELVTPANIGSLKATMNAAGFEIVELNRHSVAKDAYFYLEADLRRIGQPPKIDKANMDDAAIDAMNGNEKDIRNKIGNSETRIAVCMDIAPEHMETPWNDKNMNLLTHAFSRGYRGIFIHTHGTRKHEITNDPSNYLVLEL